MTPSPLIDAPTLHAQLRADPSTVVLDCSFELADPIAGEQQFVQGHVPGARFAHLERDLSGSPTDAQGVFRGRHPLPARDVFARWLGECGITPAHQVVAYDRQGAMFAARAWWLLHWMGHTQVRVLDGGWQAWVGAGLHVEAGAPAPRAPAAPYPPQPDGWTTWTADALLARLQHVRILDARAPERFHGQVEPIDPVAGHIPGAVNRPFKDNLQADGRFKDDETLRAEFLALIGSGGQPVVHQCGSGVTACHNLLAMRIAGLEDGALYPGSWSEWCSVPTRPVNRG
jgi:thiosulfate/3-mercaptopyruvate sulfurtransferase